MKNLKLMIAGAAAALMLAPAFAVAAVNVQDIALDKHGNPIWDARENCVYTKWTVASAGCRNYIGKEMRTVYFDFNKSNIKSSERKKLDTLIKALRGNKQVQSVDVFGHADMIGSNDYNRALSMKRAQAVRSYLSRGGIKTRKMELKALGESQSVTDCSESMPRKELIACLAKDRRVEIELNYSR